MSQMFPTRAEQCLHDDPHTDRLVEIAHRVQGHLRQPRDQQQSEQRPRATAEQVGGVPTPNALLVGSQIRAANIGKPTSNTVDMRVLPWAMPTSSSYRVETPCECPPCVAWARATPGIQTAASPRTTASHLADWDFMTPVQLAVSWLRSDLGLLGLALAQPRHTQRRQHDHTECSHAQDAVERGLA